MKITIKTNGSCHLLTKVRWTKFNTVKDQSIIKSKCVFPVKTCTSRPLILCCNELCLPTLGGGGGRGGGRGEEVVYKQAGSGDVQ